ncbi:MAG: WYL domain-containing protein [Candidatus Omnitrophica bacterium]|nr:WYL domain-containing protein [Candidatus Omnitrophota bacterium]
MIQEDIQQIEFTIFDAETTGLDPESGDRIVEIAAIRLRGQERIGSFQSLVNPHRVISPAAFAVNHISAEMLTGAPDMREVLPRFLSFMEGSCLCSYNAGFDMKFIQKERELLGMEVLSEVVIVDILKMARRLLPGLERYALWFVAQTLGIKTKQEHRAFSDVEMAIQVFDRLRQRLAQKEITDFNSFVQLFSIDRGLRENTLIQKTAQIQEAMDLGGALKIKYLSVSSAAVTEREVIPRQIRKENNQVYLVGYCRLKHEERLFRIDGILHLEIV